MWSMFLICRDYYGHRYLPTKYDSTIDELEELKNMFENLKDIVEISIDSRYVEIQGKENLLFRLGILFHVSKLINSSIDKYVKF